MVCEGRVDHVELKKKAVWTSAPSEPAPVPPRRRPGSVRRTSSMLMSWPDGLGTDLHLDGRARDLQTIEADPEPPGLHELVGCRAGGGLRGVIAEHLSEEIEGGTPLYLLLDDLAGATLIAGFTFFKWQDEYPEIKQRYQSAPPRINTNICSGFQEGSGALNPDGTLKGVSENTPPAPPLADPDDPVGWPELGDHPAIAMRRARRIDVWGDTEADTINIDA